MFDAIGYGGTGPDGFDPGWFVGISAEEHHGGTHHWLLDQVPVPLQQVTFAELWIFGNYTKVTCWDLRPFDLVHQNADGWMRLPGDAVRLDWDPKPLVNELLEGDKTRRPILVSGGPVAKKVILDYWAASLDRRVIIDIGSAIDERTRHRRTRRYQHPDNERRGWSPKWSLSDRSIQQTPANKEAVAKFGGSGNLSAPSAGASND